jgi:XTP/dITP diphosphohydrolase
MTGAGKFVEVQATAEHTPFDDAQMCSNDGPGARGHHGISSHAAGDYRRLTTLYCATGNAGKLREFRMAADSARIGIELLPGFKQLPPVLEDGATFEENAIRKASTTVRMPPACCLQTIPASRWKALGGAPGVYSARFSGPHATDDSNNRLLLEKTARRRQSQGRDFVCAIALVEGRARNRRLSRRRGRRDSRRASRRRRLRLRPLFYCPPLAAPSARQRRNRSSR